MWGTPNPALPLETGLLVAHLEEEIRWLRGQMIHERQRAEMAVDQILLLQKRPVPPITVPTMEERMFATEVAEAEAAINPLRDPEFTRAGFVDE